MVCTGVRNAQSVGVQAVEHDALHVHLHVLCEGTDKSNPLVGGGEKRPSSH